jgi:hypothetical protein
MKKWQLFLVSVLALSSLGATPVLKTVRVTLINKSGAPVEVRLTGKCQENIYYVRLAEGDRTQPAEAVVDVIPDQYSMEIFYIELWDPVYGYTCGSGAQSAAISRSTRLTVLECTNKTPNDGEPPAILKYPQSAGRNRLHRR